MSKQIMGLLTLIACLVAANANVLLAQQLETRQFDDVIYQVPEDWRSGKTRDDYATVYSKESPVPTIRIYRSANVHRSIERWARERIIESFDQDDRDEMVNFESKKVAQGTQTFHIFGTRSGRENRVAVAAVGKKKANLFLLDLRLPRRDKEETLRRITKDFLSFVTASKFTSEGAKPLLGDPVAGQLDGAYFGLAYTYNLDLSANFENKFYVFSKSGRFYRGLPIGDSVANLDFEKAIKLYPDRAGNYEVRGGKVLLDFANGKSDSKAIKSDKNTQPKALSPATIPANGVRLDGFYKDFHYSGFAPGSGVTGGVAKQKTYTFTSSGKFKATESSGVFGSFEGGGFGSSKRIPVTNGSYSILDGKLLLTNTTGKQAVCSIVQLGERLLYINGDQYLKSDPKKPRADRK